MRLRRAAVAATLGVGVLGATALIWARSTPKAEENRQALQRIAEEQLPDPSDAAAIIRLSDGAILLDHHPQILTRKRILPGSVMKLVTAYALAEAKLDDQIYECKGQWVDNWGVERQCWYRPGHGAMKLRTAIAVSCNVWFYQRVAALDPAQFERACEHFGIGSPWPSAVTIDRLPVNITPKIMPDVAVGDHASLEVTPYSLLRMVSLIATRGTRVTPGGPLERVDVDPIILEQIAIGMEEAARSGTLSEVFAGAPVAAKSGTAKRLGELGTRGLVVGYLPARAPRWAFVVVKERGRGALDSGPPAAALAKQLLQPEPL